MSLHNFGGFCSIDGFFSSPSSVLTLNCYPTGVETSLSSPQRCKESTTAHATFRHVFYPGNPQLPNQPLCHGPGVDVEKVSVSRVPVLYRVVRRFHFMFCGDCQPHATFSIKPKSTSALLKPSYENWVSSYVFPRLPSNHERGRACERLIGWITSESRSVCFLFLFLSSSMLNVSHRRRRIPQYTHVRSDHVPFIPRQRQDKGCVHSHLLTWILPPIVLQSPLNGSAR